MTLSAEPQQPLILRQMATRLHEIFDAHIDLTDVKDKKEHEKEQYFRTRAYLALYLMDQAQVSPKEAAGCICDGYDDDGIDAVFVDKKNARIYLGQSKWRANMQKGIDLAEITRFRDGVQNVLKMHWDDNNKGLHRFRSDIEALLSNINTDVIMVLAHTSDQAIAGNIKTKVDDFLREHNQFNPDFVSFEEFTIQKAARTARSLTRPENIDVPVMLAQWGLLTSPYKAIYGSIAAVDVVSWFEQHGNKLFAENLRYGIEKSAVNDGIIATANSDPEKFWYFNNGITAICDSIEKQPIGGPDTKSGVFDVKKISVINGAQTISSLFKAKSGNSDISKIRVHFRVISLNDTPEGFASQVTSANNTQNDLNAIDFVANDPHQDRIRREASHKGLVYTFRRGDKDPDRAHGFNVRSATLASACASGDLRLAVAAKRYISGLWENTKKDPYTRLFNESITASRLWSLVQIMNAVDDELAAAEQALTGRERLTAVHGNRFILFAVFEDLKSKGIDVFAANDKTLNEAADATKAVLSKVISGIAEKFSEAYPGNIFKNQERQSELFEYIKQ